MVQRPFGDLGHVADERKQAADRNAVAVSRAKEGKRFLQSEYLMDSDMPHLGRFHESERHVIGAPAFAIPNDDRNARLLKLPRQGFCFIENGFVRLLVVVSVWNALVEPQVNEFNLGSGVFQQFVEFVIPLLGTI